MPRAVNQTGVRFQCGASIRVKHLTMYCVEVKGHGGRHIMACLDGVEDAGKQLIQDKVGADAELEDSWAMEIV